MTNMNIIISKTTSRDTIQNVTELMRGQLTPAWYRLSRHRFLQEPPRYMDTLIRWGCTVSMDTTIDLAYNHPHAIRLASNKGKCRQFLYEHGVPVPKPVQRHGLLKFPLVVRPEFHQKGKGFLLFNNPSELAYAWEEVNQLRNPYFSEFYPKTTEFRVHVGHGKVLVVQQKVQTSAPVGENWSHENGYTFEVVGWKEYRKEIVDLAIRTIEVLGLDFGAVDIMADPIDSSLPVAVVCEVNTSPRLEGYTAERYAEYFDWLLENRETRHFRIPEDLRARHYAFKHRELRDCEYDLTFKED